MYLSQAILSLVSLCKNLSLDYLKCDHNMIKYLANWKISFSFGVDYKEAGWCGPHLKMQMVVKPSEIVSK